MTELADAIRNLANAVTGTSPSSLLTRSSGVLALGERKDAVSFEAGCERLDIEVASSIRSGQPTRAQLEGFLAASPHWLFLAGHFADRTLFNDAKNVRLGFHADHVALQLGNDPVTTLTKGTDAFGLDEHLEVVIWGGCDVATSHAVVEDLRQLFGEHLLLGFAGVTGWQVTNAMFGGGAFTQNHLFHRILDGGMDAASVRDAWMKMAQFGWADSTLGTRFRAVDPDGQEWKLTDGQITTGRKFA
jgi:hypothetical protein